jgi:inositol transport system ATP-binding protein
MNYPDYSDCVLAMQGISKAFPGVTALDDVNLTVYRGEIHALMGENGAGKSTLMKIVAGVYQKDEGRIKVKGIQTEIKNESHALQLGIAMVHQELNNFRNMTVAENIFAGRELSKWGILSTAVMNRQASFIMADFHLSMNTDTQMGELSISEMQLVEIAKAASCNADILIMDEPTSAISIHDAERLFEVLNRLRERGVSVVYISHKIDEVFRISDRITILRDGRWISTDTTASMDYGKLITRMVGRELKELFPVRHIIAGEIVLEIRNLSRKSAFTDISFTLRKGEVLGIAGLVGSGRTEILESVFGIYPAELGEVNVMGKPVTINTSQMAIEQGIALVPEDRKQAGLNLLASVLFNTTLPTLKNYAGRMGIINHKMETLHANKIVRQLQVRFHSLNQLVDNLSGGNQQKIILAKWLLTKPIILLLDEPTRGIDIGSKAEIYALMNKLVEEGIAILMVSSEMPELMGMCDRILALREGRISREFNRPEFNQEQILSSIMP